MRPYHHGNLRHALLDSAESLLARGGESALTLREVAKAARVSHAAPYHHFESREELLAAVGERGFDALTRSMEDARGDERERLVGICEAYVAYAKSHPAVFRVMFGPLLANKRRHAALARAAERCFGVLVGASQALSPDDALELALTGWSLAHGIAHLSIDGVFDQMPLPDAVRSSIERRLAAWVLRPARARGMKARKRSP
jgi:AcrR family transcriptional regulator